MYGFSAGKFEDGTEAYVGIGDNGGCYSQNPCPGRREHYKRKSIALSRLFDLFFQSLILHLNLECGLAAVDLITKPYPISIFRLIQI